MPDAFELEYLILALSEIGEAKISGDRLVSIDWLDIKSWVEVMDADLTAGELEALKRLSSIYVSQYYESMDSACLSPNIERPKSREAIAGKIKSMFAMLRN